MGKNLEKKFEGKAWFNFEEYSFPLHGFIYNRVSSKKVWKIEVFDDKAKGKYVIPVSATKENDKIFEKLRLQSISRGVHVEGTATEGKHKDIIRYQGIIKSSKESKEILYEFGADAYNLPNFPVMNSSIS